jgi:hypothetical protein
VTGGVFGVLGSGAAVGVGDMWVIISTAVAIGIEAATATSKEGM